MRLTRVGARNNPRFRIVVADARKRRDGRFIEMVGIYHPTEKPARTQVNRERALYWLEKGAQPTETVRHILMRLNIWSEFLAKKGQMADEQRK